MGIEDVEFGFEPSEYQKRIFDFIVHGNGNAVISAKAGSGKTSTCVEAIKLIKPKNKVIFLAFNKSISEELSRKLKKYDNVEVRTSHSLGFAIIRNNVEGDVEIDEYKYRKYVKENILELSPIAPGIPLVNKHNYVENIISLVDFSRYNLAQTSDDVKRMSEKYDIPLMYDECDVAVKVMEWGKTVINVIDYTDMVWLPVELSMSAKGFQKDFVFIDECQDQSLMSIELFLKCFKRGSRFIAVGDEKQCINVFSGASEDAFRFMKEYPKTTLFELPICYRCPRKVIELAQGIVPEIVPRDDAPDGFLIPQCRTSIFKSGDLVLCRSKGPLVKTYTKLLRKGIQCHINGKDIGSNLKDLIGDIDMEELGVSLKSDGVFVRLYDKLFEMRNAFMKNNGLDYQDATLTSYVMDRYDMISALSVLAEKCETKTELIEYIDKMFDDTRTGVILSTVHKAKGLEANDVYILCRSSMPLKLAKKEWEIEAEQNLIYVAYTRAKNRLGFVSEDEIRPFGISNGPDAILKELGIIEDIVCGILGKTPVNSADSADVSRFNLNNGITEIEDEHANDNFNVMQSEQSEDENDAGLLSELDSLIS